MLIENNFVSISDLRDKTSQVIKDLSKSGKKILLSQNKPIGIFLSIEEYNAMQKLSFEKEKASLDDIKAYKNSSHGLDGVEAFSFLNSLK
ncbi:type II toxin-antitoxin system Phd/YefM family antitoxin [Candidatus Gracilibacteria bacterium]|nr:type II toxin-antitoxin system Phd/YefM family antitoxin [Candidatus Gracilibacteria bacterium]NUJ99012.1 type II toxin-antitoxin system Phd/YefM family antitoxin [Candidatus Gracilibacteria bacterium]